MRKEMFLLQRQDNDQDRLGSHAWRMRDRDTSANPFIASTTKVCGRRRGAEELKDMLTIQTGPVQQPHSATTKTLLTLQSTKNIFSTTNRDIDESRREQGGTCMRSVGRPATAATTAPVPSITPMAARPSSSHSLAATNNAWNVVPSTRNRPNNASTRLVSAPAKRPHSQYAHATKIQYAHPTKIQYVHPTIYALMTYAMRADSPDRMAEREENAQIVIKRDPADVCMFSRVQIAGVLTLQRRFRGMLARASGRLRKLRMETEMTRTLSALKALKQSQVNTLFNRARDRDWAGEFLLDECNKTLQSVEAISAQGKHSQKSARNSFWSLSIYTYVHMAKCYGADL